MPTRAFHATRPGRRGFTIVEVVIVLMLVGIALTLAAPGFVRPVGKSEDSMQQIVDFSRRAALERAQSLLLAVGEGGAWSLTEHGAPDRPLATGALLSPSEPLQVTISPVGICIPAEDSPSGSVMIDPVTCSVVPAPAR